MKIVALLAALCCILATIAIVVTAAPAHAKQTQPVAAGDTITHGNNKCTLGYVYRVHGHTMGVTAGHCADPNAKDSPVLNPDAGVAGYSVSATYIPGKNDGPPQRDWWLIDFGDVAWSDRIAGTNYRILTYVNADPSDWVCHYGSTSDKEVCGFVLDVDNPVITVTQTGQRGDSGGPTYIKITDSDVALIGLWQGHFKLPHPGGFVISLPAALTSLRANSIRHNFS